MKHITKIEKQIKRKNRYSIFIDEVFAFGVDEDVLINLSLTKDMEVSDSFINDVIKLEENTKAFNCAINLLSYGQRSISELKTKLKLKGYEEDAIDYSIELLKKYNYLDDYAFGKSFIKDKQNFKSRKESVKAGTLSKGIQPDMISELIEACVNEDEEYERALELARKKARTFNSKDDANARYRKLSGQLARKGYSFDIISKIIKEVLSNVSDDNMNNYD